MSRYARLAGRVLVAFGLIGGTAALVGPQPAHAQDWRGHDRDRHDRDRHDHDRDRRGYYAPGYYAQPNYYAPPPVVYAPPGPPPGLNVFLNLR